jgi:voltage-gated potassium channel
VGNPLLVLWYRIFADDEEDRKERAVGRRLPDISDQRASAGVLLVLRRMRIPVIVLIAIFAVSVLGLTLIPGQDDQGRLTRMGIFESFYFMSSTATTIGFGEIPYSFTPAQRMWVTFSIFLSVIGWAYAIGSLLALMQDRAFRRALARTHFARKVAHMGEPFLLLVGYGNAVKRLARSLDDMGRRFVVVDYDENRVAAVDLDSYRADTPALLGDARDTGKLVLAGLGHRHCEGVVALTGDDETNLHVTMTAALLRPGLPVIARTTSRDVAERMRAFGAHQVVNPFDRFGDHLRILLRSPASYQLMVWLTSAPGTPLPPRRDPLPGGRWVVCGYGRFGREVTADLRAEGIEVTIVEGEGSTEKNGGQIETAAIEAADVEHAAAFVAATESDTTNLWLVEAARRANPDAFLVAMENRTANFSLFRAVGVDFAMVPAEVIAHEVLARLANPMLMRFLPQVPHQGEKWAERMVERLVDRCGTRMPNLWRIRLTEEEAPALTGWLRAGELRLGDLVRSPEGREHPLDAVPLALLREGTSVLAPDDDHLLQLDDQLLIAGRPAARWALEATFSDEPTAAYVIGGQVVPSGWIWRRLSRQGAGRPGERV